MRPLRHPFWDLLSRVPVYVICLVHTFKVYEEHGMNVMVPGTRCTRCSLPAPVASGERIMIERRPDGLCTLPGFAASTFAYYVRSEQAIVAGALSNENEITGELI